METILEVRNLEKKYKNFSLKSINFNIGPGEIIGLIGQNGAGKSTLLKILMNIIDQDSGEIKFLSKLISKNEYNYKKNIGYVGENILFYENQTLHEIKKFYCMYFPNWDEDLYKKISSEVFNLDKNKKLKELSKGMKVKFYISLCISHKPKLFILDEPTSGLDLIVREKILRILRDHVNENESGMIFSSHITEDMDKIADKLIFIHDGNILDVCDISDISRKNKTVDNYYKELLIKNGVKYE